MNKKGNNNYYKYILLTILIVCIIFRYKNIYIEPNKVLDVSISNILYPFTFLITILLFEKTNFKLTHITIIKSSITTLVFMLLITIMINIPGTMLSREMDTALKTVLAPNYFFINNTLIYYPNILNIITFGLLFYFSHTLLLILYEAILPYTKKFIAFSLAMFIPYALDTICLVAITDTFSKVETNVLITHMTANFVIVIIGTLLISTIYSLKKSKN